MSDRLAELQKAIGEKNQAETTRLLSELSELNDQEKADALVMIAALQSEIADEVNKELIPILQQTVATLRNALTVARTLSDSEKIQSVRADLNS